MSTPTIDWITALAQNDYKQGTGRMSSAFGVEGGLDVDPTDGHTRGVAWGKVPATSSFCCLGVNRFMDTHEIESGSQDEYDTLTPDLWEYEEMGLTNKGVDQLVTYNDTMKLSFPEIALRVLRDPHLHFVPEVAEEVIEHFWHRGGV